MSSIPFFVIKIFLCSFFTSSLGALCGRGYFSKDARCHPCPAGTYSLISSSTECFNCPKNTFRPYETKPDPIYCRPCPFNAYSRPGSASCRKCPRGLVRDGDTLRCRPCRKSECRCAKSGTVCPDKCPRGFGPATEVASYFATCVDPATGCPPRTRLRNVSVANVCVDKEERVVCPPSHIYDGYQRCLSCFGNGRIIFINDSKLPRFFCSICPAQTNSFYGPVSKCTFCPPGFNSEVSTNNGIPTCSNPFPKYVDPRLYTIY